MFFFSKKNKRIKDSNISKYAIKNKIQEISSKKKLENENKSRYIVKNDYFTQYVYYFIIIISHI